MANPYLVLWCDANTNTLYSGWNSQTFAPIPVLKQGDDLGVEIHWIRANNGGSMEEVVFPPAASVKLALGLIDVAPTSGTFKLTYGANTTTALNYNATAEQVAAALNALASVTAEGGVSVVKSNNQYRIVWNNVGTTSNVPTADVELLSPFTNWSSIVYRAGSATKSQVILLKLRQAPVAATTTFTTKPAPEAVISSSGSNNWSLKFTEQVKSGYFRLSITRASVVRKTAPIPFDSSPEAILLYIGSMDEASATGATITRFSDSINIFLPAASAVTVEHSLVGFSAVVGQLSMNTAELEELISGNTSTQVVLEVETDIDGEVQTIIQTNAVILNDLVDQSAFEMVELGQVIPAEAIVRYDTSQALTSAEQLQARTNIGAGEQADIDSIDTRVTNIENDYATNTALVSGLAGKSNVGHTHTASEISDSTAAGRAVLTAADAAAQRTTLGLGTMAVETASNYLTTANALITYLSISSAASTYLTQTSAASLYLPATEASKIPSADEKDAMTGLAYSTTPPSSTNVFLTKSDFDANFVTETHPIAPSSGTNHNSSNVIATGIIPNPDSTKNWLVTVAFNYSGTSTNLLSDVWWRDTNHELYFAPQGTLTPVMVFARNSFQFVLNAGDSGYEFWSSAHAAFSTLSGELYICYKSM